MDIDPRLLYFVFGAFFVVVAALAYRKYKDD